MLSNAVVINNATSPFNSNGSAAVSANGGAGNYTFLWDNGQTTNIATGLSAGNQCITTTDANAETYFTNKENLNFIKLEECNNICFAA